MDCCNWLIAGQTVYSAGYYKNSRDGQWCVVESIPDFYKNVLSSVPVKLKKSEKFFRFNIFNLSIR